MRTRSLRVFSNFQAKFFNDATHKVTLLRRVVPDRKFYEDDYGAIYAVSYPIYCLLSLWVSVVFLGS
jgi:hypothetical protein